MLYYVLWLLANCVCLVFSTGYVMYSDFFLELCCLPERGNNVETWGPESQNYETVEGNRRVS